MHYLTSNSDGNKRKCTAVEQTSERDVVDVDAADEEVDDKQRLETKRASSGISCCCSSSRDSLFLHLLLQLSPAFYET